RSPFSGRLFTVLPLPISTPFPIHIHGIFGLTRDRRNLISHCSDHAKGSKPDIVADWNQHLFRETIPSTWSRFLVELVETYRGSGNLPYWPPELSNLQNVMWKNILPDLLRRVSNDRLS